MSVWLLDVNVLISLFDAAHEHHELSRRWFQEVGAVEGWATCPITENGVIRVMTNASYPNHRLRAAEVAESLRLLQRSFAASYQFWPDAVSLCDEGMFDLEVLVGARQTTDVYLAGLAFQQGGRLATLDGGVAWRAVRGATAGLMGVIGGA